MRKVVLAVLSIILVVAVGFAIYFTWRFLEIRERETTKQVSDTFVQTQFDNCIGLLNAVPNTDGRPFVPYEELQSLYQECNSYRRQILRGFTWLP